MKPIFTFFLLFFTQFLFAQTFTEVMGTPFEKVASGSIAFADVDGDTDQDLLITGRTITNERIAKLYSNDGAGNFTEVTGTPFEGIEEGSASFADIDGDGDQDLLIAGSISTKLYANDGAGNFTEVMGTPFERVIFGSIAFADIDGDSDQDLLITGRTSGSQRIAKLYSNDGGGAFSEVLGTSFDGVEAGSISFADINNDGDQDLLVTGVKTGGSIAKLYANDGAGNFTEVIGVPFEGIDRGTTVFLDVDSDNDQDLLIAGRSNANDRIAKLYANDGGGTFTEVMGTALHGMSQGDVSLADIDGDGDQDLLITGLNYNVSDQIAKLYTNDGGGTFTEVMGTPFEEVYESSTSFADIDGDGDQDLLITGVIGLEYLSKLYTNDRITSINTVSNLSGISYTLNPNPTVNDMVNIRMETERSSQILIRLFDVTGRQLRQQKEQLISGENNILFNISNLESGTYFIEIGDDQSHAVQKLIIM